MITFIDHIYLLQEKPSGKAALWTWETHGITKEGHLGIRERGVGDKGRWGVTCNERRTLHCFWTGGKDGGVAADIDTCSGRYKFRCRGQQSI